MNLMIIPIVTEKANAISEKTNRFSFKVSPDANKYQIKDAVEKLYDVKVAVSYTHLTLPTIPWV